MKLYLKKKTKNNNHFIEKILINNYQETKLIQLKWLELLTIPKEHRLLHKPSNLKK